MPLLRRLAWIGCIALLSVPHRSAAQSSPHDRAGLVRLVLSVQDADYRGDLARLRSIAAEMQPYTTHPALARSARYWRGFAFWRRALNSLNAGTPAESANRDFEASIAEFRAALAMDAQDVEAQIGLAAWLGNRAYFKLRSPEQARVFLSELRPLVTSLRRVAAENPRAAFVVAPTLFWSPPERGGDRASAMTLLEESVRRAAARPTPGDTLEPSWAEAELHMLLSWYSLNLEPPDVPSALGHAEAALVLRPRWRYVRENLLPLIRRRLGQPQVVTTAYRVHDMPALGIEVPDVEAILAVARRHGRVEDAPRRQAGRLHVAIREPDGNTLEVYGP